MRNTILIAILGIALATFASCAVGPVHGGLFTSTKFAGEINPHNDVAMKKTGEGCTHQILGLIAMGDSGAGDVSQINGIQKIALIDHSAMSVLGIYARYCTIVSGE